MQEIPGQHLQQEQVSELLQAARVASAQRRGPDAGERWRGRAGPGTKGRSPRTGARLSLRSGPSPAWGDSETLPLLWRMGRLRVLRRTPPPPDAVCAGPEPCPPAASASGFLSFSNHCQRLQRGWVWKEGEGLLHVNLTPSAPCCYFCGCWRFPAPSCYLVKLQETRGPGGSRSPALNCQRRSLDEAGGSQTCIRLTAQTLGPGLSCRSLQ